MLPGPVGGTWRPRRPFTNSMSICFGVQGAPEIVVGAKNLLSGCLTRVPLDRNSKKLFFHADFFSFKKQQKPKKNFSFLNVVECI